MDFIAILTAAGVPHAMAWVGFVAGCASFIAAIAPHPPEGSRWALLRNLVDTLAVNIGSAANATPPTTSRGAPGVPLAMLLLLASCGPGATGSVTVAQLQSALVPGLVCALDTAGKIQAVAATNDTDAHKAVQAAVVAGAALAGDTACVKAMGG
jgi:hypothetical protein